MKKQRIYLDNCCFNRPYDDQSVIRNYLETEAKLFIQAGILHNIFELAWSYILDFENSLNPYSERRNQITKWESIAIVNIAETSRIIQISNDIMKIGLKPKDALHIACAIEADCTFFITTDGKILNKPINQIVVINPVDFINFMEEPK